MSSDTAPATGAAPVLADPTARAARPGHLGVVLDHRAADRRRRSRPASAASRPPSGTAGGAVTAIDVVDSRSDGLTVDVTCSAADAAHSEEMVEALRDVPGVKVRKVSDRTFLLHLGGKIEVTSKVPLKTRDDLSMAYTPGVARVCLALAEHPEDVRRLTIKGNTVAVVTDGSAVLGLGDIGPGAALPVMEGKAALFKRFADIDAWPICLDTQDVDEIVRTVELIAPGFGGINLEDIAAPRCFEIERRLREKLDIPVFHDDQHGTAIVALAALKNALRVVDKQLPDVKIVVAGGGAAGTAIVHLLLAGRRRAGARLGPRGHPLPGRRAARPGASRSSPRRTNPGCVRGELPDALDGADVFIGVSAGNVLAVEDLARMAERAVVFPMANPTPEVDPVRARAVRRRSSRPAARTCRTRSTTCWRSPACSAGCSTPGPPRSATACCWPRPTRWPPSSATTSSTPTSSSRACSTPPSPRRSRRRSPSRPARSPAPRCTSRAIQRHRHRGLALPPRWVRARTRDRGAAGRRPGRVRRARAPIPGRAGDPAGAGGRAHRVRAATCARPSCRQRSCSCCSCRRCSTGRA